MTDLNKQWYEETLEKDKYYYAKDSSEGDCIVHINKSNEMTFTGWEVPYKPDQSNILEPFKLRTELLAQVPSYEEWKASYNCMLENEVLRLKNAQLKELLKECREPLEVLADKRNTCDWYPENLLAKIDEVLK